MRAPAAEYTLCRHPQNAHSSYTFDLSTTTCAESLVEAAQRVYANVQELLSANAYEAFVLFMLALLGVWSSILVGYVILRIISELFTRYSYSEDGLALCSLHTSSI